MKKVSDNKI